MNTLIILQSELTSEYTAKITGSRLEYVKKAHSLSDTAELNAGILGSDRIRVKILDFSENELVIKILSRLPALKKENITLIVGIPRPQAIKRIIQTATLCGVQNIHFVKAKNCDPSYIQSKELTPERYTEEIIKGLEQSGDTIPPVISTHKNLSIIKTGLSDETLKIVGDQNGTSSNTIIPLLQKSHKVIAIGPELGWTEDEISLMCQNGFINISLGNRTLRTDTAVAVMLGKVIW